MVEDVEVKDPFDENGEMIVEDLDGAGVLWAGAGPVE